MGEVRTHSAHNNTSSHHRTAEWGAEQAVVNAQSFSLRTQHFLTAWGTFAFTIHMFLGSIRLKKSEGADAGLRFYFFFFFKLGEKTQRWNILYCEQRICPCFEFSADRRKKKEIYSWMNIERFNSLDNSVLSSLMSLAVVQLIMLTLLKLPR